MPEFLKHSAVRAAEAAQVIEWGFGPGEPVEVLDRLGQVITRATMGDDQVARIPVEELGDWIVAVLRSKRTGHTVPVSDWDRERRPGSIYQLRVDASLSLD